MNKGKLIKRTLIVTAILVGLWFLYFETVVPYVAKANIPYRWQNIPLGQKRFVVHEYIGEPGIDAWNVKGDEWTKNVKANRVFLNIRYNSDTIAIRYRIGFVYNHWFGRRIYYLKRDSI